MGRGILLPDGLEIPLQRDVIPLTVGELRKMAAFHEVASKFGFVVVCPKCDYSLKGENNDSQGGVYVVSCKCREYRCDING